MYNKKVLSTAKKELTKAKAPAKPKDIITDPMGQWKYPGLPTRIPSNDITMKGVGYPVLGVANNGQRKIMLPGADYTFPGADYVDEYPQMRKGGVKKKKTKSLSGTNKLMLTHPLLRNYKNKVYDPNVDYFQEGGIKTVKSKDGTVTNRFINEAGDEVVQVKTKDGKYTEKVIPAIQQQKTLRDIEKIVKVPFHPETEEEYDKLPADEKLRRFERTVDVNLGYPQKRAAQVAQDVTEPGNDPVDNIRHPFAGRYTAEAAYNSRKKNAPWAPDWLNKAGAWVDANALGVGHEATTLFKDKRPWGTKLRESAEDIYNNAVGVNVGLSDRSEREKDMTLINKSRYNKIPDGFGEERPFQLTNPKWTDPYDKKQDGGYIEAELTDDEIEEYRKGGYIVEDISVPELNQAQKGKFVAPPLPIDKTRSETTQMVSLPARQAVLHVKNKPAADKALKKEKKEQQKFKDELWKKYKKLPLSEKISDRVGAFINDPLGMTSRALLGEQAYIPGMAQGLHDYENPEVREKYLKELGYTPGEFDASDIQNMINPGNWVTSITENTRKGNIGTAALEGALMFLPHLPKGTISRSNIRSGAKLLNDDVMGYINKKNTPKYVNLQDQIDDIVKNSSFKTEDEALDYLKDLAKKENKNVFDLLETYSKKGFGFSGSNPWAAAEVIKSDLNPYISPYLYHGTSDARLKSILELGLDNSKGKAINTGGAMADVLGGGRTTAAGDMAYAKTFSELSADATKGKPVILRFKNKNKENLGFLGSHPAVKNKDIEYSFDGGKTWSNKPNFNAGDLVKAGLDGNFLTRPLTLFTKNELLGTPDKKMLYRKIGNAKGLQDLIEKQGAQAPKPMRMTSGATIDTPFFGVGTKPNENYGGLFAVEVDPSNPKYSWSNNVGGVSNYGVAPYNPETGELMKNIPLEDLNVYKKKWFSNNYKKLKPEELEAALMFAREQALIENAYKWGVRGTAADQIFNDGDYAKAIQNYFLGKPNTSRKKREETDDNYEKGGIVADLTPEEIQDYIAQGYAIEEVDEPELIEAQNGIISTKEHTDKKGNKTIKVQKEDGTVYTKVIGKDGKVYNRTFDPKKDSWVTDQTKNLYSKPQGAGNYADEFFTEAALLPGTVKGVKAAAPLVKQGLKTLMTAAPAWAPGANLGNFLTAAGGVMGVNEYVDPNSDVRKASKKAYKNPTVNNITDAIYENTLNALNFSGFGAGSKVKNLKNYLNPKYSKASQIENTFIPNTLIQHPDNSYVLQNNSVKDFGITPEIKNLPTKDSHKFEVTKDEVKQLIDQNLEYLTHPNYIKRRQATTGESTKKIEKEINKYVENLKKTSIDLNNTRYGKKGYGAYLRSLKLLGIPLTKPKILINSSDKFFKTKSDLLHVLDHEIKHALSPVVESDFKALPKYKNYPHLNLVDKKTANSKYHSADDEQQVRFLRMKDYLHNKYGISKHEPISPEDWDLFKNDWNNWLKENHIVAGDKKVPRGMSDIKGMMELKDPKVTSDALRNLVNKAWVAAPATGMLMMQNSQNKKQKGGVVAELSDDEIQDYINQGYVVEEV